MKNLHWNVLNHVLLAVAGSALLSTPGYSQSLDVKNPAGLQEGPNRGIIDSFGGEQFWTFTAQPGDFKVVFARTDAKEGFNVGAKVGVGAVIAPKVQGSTIRFVETPTGTTFTGHAAAPSRVLIMVEPAKSPLVRQTNEYFLTVSGNLAASSPAPQVATITGMYNTGLNDYGFVKFQPDGTIETTGDARGTWKLFDAGTQAYIVMIAGNKYMLTNQPGRGLVDNNGNLMFQQKK